MTSTPAACSSPYRSTTGRVWHETTSLTWSVVRPNSWSSMTTSPSRTSRTVAFVMTVTGCLNGREVSASASPCAKRLRRTYMWMTSHSAANSRFSVTIVTEKREFAAECEVIHMYVLRKRFAQGDAEALTSRPFKHPVTVITNATVREVREGEVVIEDHDFGRTTIQVSDVVSCQTRPVVDLYAELRAAGIHVINVGDSMRPRNLYYAVKEGSALSLIHI